MAMSTLGDFDISTPGPNSATLFGEPMQHGDTHIYIYMGLSENVGYIPNEIAI